MYWKYGIAIEQVGLTGHEATNYESVVKMQLGWIEATDVGTVHVATQGEPNVIRVESEDGDILDYSEHGKPADIKEPPAEEVIDLADVVGTAP